MKNTMVGTYVGGTQSHKELIFSIDYINYSRVEDCIIFIELGFNC